MGYTEHLPASSTTDADPRRAHLRGELLPGGGLPASAEGIDGDAHRAAAPTQGAPHHQPTCRTFVG